MLGGGTQTAVAVTAAAVNVVLPGVGTAIAAIGSLLDVNGPKKIAATVCANNTEFSCEALVREWNNYPPQMKTKELQTQYLNASLELWKYLEQCCDQPNLGSAGQRCVSERDHGGKYDYWPGCYDAIANDPQVVSNMAVNQQFPVISGGNRLILPTSVINPVTGATGLVSYVENNPLVDLGIVAVLLLVIL